MVSQEMIALFGGRRLDVHQARGVILALSGADVIREWEVLASSDSHAAHAKRCYAAIVPRDRDMLDQRRPLVGRGTTPAGAIEDLLWKLVTPRLLAE